MIAIINGCGTNIASLQFALDRLNKQSVLTTDHQVIRNASHVILPGVGAAQNAMQALQKHQLLDVIRHLQQPVLGICLGMQLLYEFSQEGNTPCLNIIPSEIKSLLPQENITIPHMGWNQLHLQGIESHLIQGIPNKSWVYFVHGYHAPVNEYTIATTQHGNLFSAIVQKNNFFGVQFHPERSANIGAKLLANFLRMD